MCTYNDKDALTSLASELYEKRPKPCPLSPLVFMTAPKRVPDILASTAKLPKGSAIIYRHFGDKSRFEMAEKLRQICFARGLQFLIGADEELARTCGADGLHLPERALEKANRLRNLYPDWIISAAAHSLNAIKIAEFAGLDAVIVSPVFASQSPSAGRELGLEQVDKWAKNAQIPVFGLGGINAKTAKKLTASKLSGIACVSALV